MPALLVPPATSAAIACALRAGAFPSFSDFVTRSLQKPGRRGAVEAMLHVNREVFRTLFIALLVGGAAISPLIVLIALPHSDNAARVYVLAGSAIYLVAVFAVTLLGNVPANIPLDRLNRHSPEVVVYWPAFYSGWTNYNHIRTVRAAAAVICYLLASLTLAAS
ncbi:putative membrane protein [Hyphomonas neptunium ATCC 15444]|uniref:Integral membrane protein n=2 Tax=Hyphomonas TaxID=85 RepID=A0A059FR48_9PROT|nr:MULTISPECIES: anthrone oxygenase family protein [Hyphomonas]ABI76344.1 putative membrane protein [Hyphomonas neptunium ATCC 15444]KCZ93067.1 hypothetical protein HHI_10279 [Hyphomonas hirschiana VP5]